MATIQTSIMLEDRMSQQFAAMNMAMLSVIDSFEQLESVSSQAIDVTALRQAQTQLQGLEASFNQVEQEILQSERAQENFNRDLRTSDDLASKLLGTIAAISGTYLSLQGLESLINTSDEMTNTTARIDLLVNEMPVIQQDLSQVDLPLTADVAVNLKTDTAELADLSSNLSQIEGQIPVEIDVLGLSEVELAQQLIYESAQRSYSSFKDTADLVTRIGMSAGDAFGSTAEVIAFSELVQKQFGIAGASAVEASNATIQLSQALASGVLRGDELNSIFEQAPNLIMSIADYLEVPIGAIRDMAADGEITADIVKQAMFAAADDINGKFDSMPVTWSQIWTNFKNDALWAFRDVLAYINEIANSEGVKAFLSDLKVALFVVADIMMWTMQIIGSVSSFIYEHWSMIGPLIMGIIGALMTFYMVTKLVQGVTWLVTAAQWAYNAALTANPVFLFIAGIVLLIGIFYAAIATINHFADTSYSATGIVAGAFAALGAFIYNIVAFWWNLFASITEFFVNVWQHKVYSVKALFVNLANTALNMAESMIGSFDSAATNLANMFIDAANMAVKAINWVIEALNNVPGIDIGTIGEFSHKTSITADYSGLRDKMDNWLGEAPTDYWEAPKMEMKSIPDSYMSGYNWGEDLFSKDQSSKDKQITNSYDDLAALSGLGDMANALDDLKDPGKETAKNTKKLADSATILEDDLKYLRDLSEREAINRYTTAEIKVDMKNENHINSEMDIDGVIDRFGEKVEEVAEILAEGGEVDV
ncbi:MAG TPA: tape measure protein [Solibacillus sp.]